MAKSVYSKEERKEQFVKTGIKLAKKVGLDKVSASSVAKEHKITAPLIFHIFGTREKFHAAIKAAAKKQGVDITGPKKAVPARKRSIGEVRAIKDKLHRSAKTGRVVTAEFAKANPDTTVAEAKTRAVKSAAFKKAAKPLAKKPAPRKTLPKPEKPKYPTLPKPAAEDVGINLVQKV